jgi:hypothetical protein
MAISFKGAHFPPEVILMGVRWYTERRYTAPPPDFMRYKV